MLRREWLVQLIDIYPAKRDVNGHPVTDGDGENIYDASDIKRDVRCFVSGRIVRNASNYARIEIPDGEILHDPETILNIDDRVSNPRDQYFRPTHDFVEAVIVGPDAVYHIERGVVIVGAPYMRR